MHFLHADERPSRFGSRQCANKPWACVTVRVEKNRLVIQHDSIGVLNADAEIVRLPERMAVVSEDGAEVKPSRGRAFYVTVETIDPFHCLTEL